MQKRTASAAIIAAMILVASPALAHTHHGGYRHVTSHSYAPAREASNGLGWGGWGSQPQSGYGHPHFEYASRGDHSRPADCYGIAWCGCWLRNSLGIADKALNLARNWVHVGSNASGPHVGAIVVWQHHVGRIVGPPDASGRWLIQSGNDGNAVRTRYLSVGRAIAFRTI